MIGVAYNSQILRANLHVVLNFFTFKALQLLFYSYWKVLKVSSVSVVENEQSSPEITFKVIKESLLVFLNTSQKVADYLLQ
jgi:hypothetical protein